MSNFLRTTSQLCFVLDKKGMQTELSALSEIDILGRQVGSFLGNIIHLKVWSYSHFNSHSRSRQGTQRCRAFKPRIKLEALLPFLQNRGCEMKENSQHSLILLTPSHLFPHSISQNHGATLECEFINSKDFQDFYGRQILCSILNSMGLIHKY